MRASSNRADGGLHSTVLPSSREERKLMAPQVVLLDDQCDFHAVRGGHFVRTKLRKCFFCSEMQENLETTETNDIQTKYNTFLRATSKKLHSFVQIIAITFHFFLQCIQYVSSSYFQKITFICSDYCHNIPFLSPMYTIRFFELLPKNYIHLFGLLP